MSDSLKILLKSGQELHELGRYTEAIDKYRQAIQIDRYNSEIYYYQGLSFEALGDRQNTIKSWDKALEINPEHTEIRSSRRTIICSLIHEILSGSYNIIRSSSGEIHETEEYKNLIEKIFKLKEQKDIVINLLSKEYLIDINFLEILQYNLRTNAESQNLINIKLIKDSVSTFFEICKKLNDANDEINIEKWRKGKSLFAKFTPNLEYLLITNRILGLANTIFITIVFSYLTSLTFKNLFWLSLLTGFIAFSAALLSLSNVQQFRKKIRADKLCKERKYGKSLYLLNSIFEVEPQNYNLICNIADIHRRSHNYQEALANYDRALEIKYDYISAWHNRGLTLVKLCRYEEALASYDVALYLLPFNIDTWNNRGMVLEELGRKLEAYYTFEKALKIHKLLQANYFSSFDSHQIWFNMGIIAWGMRDYAKAQENFCRALMAKFDFNKANAFYKASLGKISYLNSDWDEALYHYKEALPIFEQLIQNPGVLENDVAMWSVAVYICYADIIDICVKLNNIQSAIEYLEKVKGRYFKESLARRARRPTPVLSDSADPIFQHYIDATNILSEASDYWILKSFPENYQPPDISFEYIVNDIIDNESVLIEYSCTTKAIYAFVITHDFSRIFIISENGNTDLESYFNLYLEKYNDYGKCIQNAKDNSVKNICRQEWLENLSSHFEKLSELLKLNDIICCINKLAPSCKKLIIIPHDFLYSLPIHAFPISIGDEDKLLIDYFSGGIRYAPSCALIHLIEERQNHWKYFNNQENQDILSCLFAIQNPTEDLECADIEVDILTSCTNT